MAQECWGGWSSNLGIEKSGGNRPNEASEDRVIQLCDTLLRKIKPGISMSEALAANMFFFDRGDRQAIPVPEGAIQQRFKVERDKTIDFKNFFTALRNWFGRGTRENLARDKNKQHPPRIVLAPITRTDARALFDALNVVPGSDTISLHDMAKRMEQYRSAGRVKGPEDLCEDLVDRIRRKGRSGRMASAHFDHNGALGAAVLCHNLEGPLRAIENPGTGEDVRPKLGALGDGLFGLQELQQTLRIVLHQPPQRDEQRVKGKMPEEEFVAAVKVLFQQCREIGGNAKISLEDLMQVVEEQRDPSNEPGVNLQTKHTCAGNILHHLDSTTHSHSSNRRSGNTSGSNLTDPADVQYALLSRLHRMLPPSSRHMGGLITQLGAFGQGGPGGAGGER